MNILPIHKTNFNGKFQKTPALEKVMKNADKDSLGNFNEVIQRINKIDDGYIFKLDEFKPQNSTPIYNLYRKDTKKNLDTVLVSVITKADNTLGSGAKPSEILAKFIPILNAYYPVTYKEPKEELIASINSNLIE